MSRRLAGCICVAMCAAASGSWAAEPPQTVEDHLKLAAMYYRQATAAHEEVTAHRAMLRKAYLQEVYSKAPIRRAYEKMRQHCDPIIREAERQAAESERLAQYHESRGQQPQEGGRDDRSRVWHGREP